MGVTGLSDNFPFNKKIGCFCKAIFSILFAKTTLLIVDLVGNIVSDSRQEGKGK